MNNNKLRAGMALHQEALQMTQYYFDDQKELISKLRETNSRSYASLYSKVQHSQEADKILTNGNEILNK